jgi:hypothetical protein
MTFPNVQLISIIIILVVNYSAILSPKYSEGFSRMTILVEEGNRAVLLTTTEVSPSSALDSDLFCLQ